MAKYYLDEYGVGTTKKPKKKKKGKTYVLTENGTGREYVEPNTDDIAPVKTTTTSKKKEVDILGAITSGAYLNSIAQSGRIITTEDLEMSRKVAKQTTESNLLNGWFKKSEGNTAETIVGSSTDATKNILSGGISVPEWMYKGAMAIAPAWDMSQKISAGQMMDEEDWEQRRKLQEYSTEVLQKDYYDEDAIAEKILKGVASSGHFQTVAQSGGMMTEDDLEKMLEIQTQAENYLQNDMEKHSVFDEKSDELFKSSGQMLATSGLQAVTGGVIPWWAITGMTTLGNETENALKEGATYDEAVASGLISAGAEILSEKLTGGINFGSKTLTGELFDDKISNLLSQAISNKAIRSLVKIGYDATGEGFEEVFSDAVSRVGKKLTYEDEKTWAEILTSEEAMQSYLDSFFGGVFMGSVASGSRAIRTEADGVDFTTENTHNEQKVVDAETQKRIEETEKELKKKLNTSEKVKIRKQVQTEMERGELSTDTIEFVLGGETYEAYKSSTDEINSLKEQQKALQEQLKDPRSGVQNQAKQELSVVEKKLSELEKNYANADFKNKLSSEVYELTKNERLSESYREVERKSQVFEADLTQYDSKTQETVKRAIDSGILNNTRKTHDFVDLIAKLSAEKGVSFDFTNNEALKNSGFAIEGKTINGLVQGKDVILNIDSSKSLNTVVGHEITHVLEGTELYTELQNMIVEYAKSRGDYDARYKALQGIYKDVKDANIDNELTADLVGDYLFTDEDFVRNLSAEKPSVFKKIFEEIKYLCKVATAGSKEARELEKVKRVFEKAFKENGNVQNVDSTKYSIVESFVDDNGTEFKNAVLLDTDFFDGTPPRNWGEKLKELVESRANDNPFIMPIVDESGNTTLLQFAKPNERVTKDGKSNHKVTDKLSSTSDNISKLAVVHIDEIVNISDENSPYYTNENYHQWLDKKGWLHRNANVINKKNGVVYNVTLDIAKTEDGRTILYATNGKIKKVGNVNVNSLKIKGSWQNSNFKDSVTQNSENASDNYSLEDSNGKTLSKEQQEYFKDSKVRDENGNLKVMYHGTPNGDFTVFRDGTYFTSNKDYADVYQNQGASSLGYKKTATNPKTYEVYLNIKKPFDTRNAKERAIFENEYYGQWGMGTPLMESGLPDWMDGEDLREFLQEKGYDYDGLILDEGGVGGYGDEVKSRGLSYVVFNSNQIKNIDNTKPTTDADIRYSLSEDSKSTDDEYLKVVENGDMETAQRMVDEVAKKEGYTIRAYHGTNALFNVFDSGMLGSKNFMATSAYKGFFASKSKETAENYTGLNSMDMASLSLNKDAQSKMEEIKAKHNFDKAHKEYNDAREKFFNEYKNEHGYKEAVTDIINRITENADKIGFDESAIRSIKMSFEYDWNTRDSGNGQNHVNRMHSEFELTDEAKKFEELNQQIFGEWEQSEIERKGYTPNVKNLYLKITNPLVHDFKNEGRDVDFTDLIDEAKKNGNDGCIFKNVQDGGDFDDIYVVFENTQLKSADAVTYDDNGNVVPLSERFKAENPDTRYSMGEEIASHGNYNVYGKDIALPSALAPTEEIAPNPTVSEESINERSKELHSKLKKKKGVYAEQGTIEGWNYYVYNSASKNETVVTWWNDNKERFNAYHELGTSIEDALYSVTDFIAKRELGNSEEQFVEADNMIDAPMPEDSIPFDDFQVENERPNITTPKELRNADLTAIQTELENDRLLREESYEDYNREIERLQAEFDAKKNKNTKVAQNLLRRIERTKRLRDSVDADYSKRINDLEKREQLVRTGKPTSRQQLHNDLVGKMKTAFTEKGYDLDAVLEKAKDLSTFATVDNTPQRVMEKALGYKEGQVLSDLTVNKVAQNETEGIKWLNSFTDRKNGLLAQISKQYNIKAGSKESAVAQMYAEGFYVDENNNIIKYGDEELAKDFPNPRVQANIKGLANDPRIRQIYDETLKMINDSRTRNAYPEIPRLDNYFLHFRAMDDTFSRLGLPFNPNDIRAKDLPTDLNGVTADLKPGQPYFASAMHRTGKRTSFDLLGGLERYLTSAKNQIYHIDDIQTLRALRNYIADTYGQAHGLDNIDNMSEEEVEARIKEVYNSHLSTFAKFLNEEANVLAGKTTLIDRGLEGIIGRRGITFLDTVNRQVGSNMVGLNVSSSLTNFLSVAQGFAKTKKSAFVKAFAQTVSNKISSVYGKGDGFAEQSPVMIRRKGADRFYRTPWQKGSDAGYVLMSAVDNISTELIARAKYNELISSGMDSQKAHYETDKWVSRLMGDRSLGQQPQLYNSKMLGLFTKFQLEVRNQLDSQFYDTIQEAKVSNEDIQNGLERNARISAKITSTFVQLAVAQHLFGTAFESVAGYNPAFDIIEVLLTAFGFDDEEDSEDTALDNLEQGFLALVEDLPYTSTFTGGRIPIESALPIKELITGKDEYGNDKDRLKTLGEIAPYYLLPTGYGQIKKTAQGLGMFDDDLPTSGSYTKSGNLRFPVEDTLGNRIQAGIFGQYANENARNYFDNERNPLKEKQIQEYVDLDLPIADYWQYREGLAEQKTLEDKFDYIADLDVSVEQKNIMINNVVDRKEKVDMSNYDDFANYEEFDFYAKNTEKYNFLQANNISYEEYKSSKDAKEEYDEIYSWYKNNPEKVTLSQSLTDNVIEYRRWTGYLNDIRADKDADGDSISGSAKAKKIAYINSLDLDYGQKLIFIRSLYDSNKDKEAYDGQIIDYLNNRSDISYEEMVTILGELGMKVHSDGSITY